MRRSLVLLGLCGACAPSPDATDAVDLLVEVDGVLHLGRSGRAELTVLEELEPGADAVWSPGGDRIARVDDARGIRVLDLGGTPPSDELVLAPASKADQLAWSPDGLRIAFREEPDAPAGLDGQREYELAVVATDGSAPVRLSQTADVTERWPTWSADGRFVAVSADRLQLYTIDGELGPAFAVAPERVAWSADGSRLLVLGDDGLVFVDVATGQTEAVTSAIAFAWFEPDDAIAVGVVRRGEGGELSCDVGVLGEADERPRPIATAPAGACYRPLEWSPDGRRLLVSVSWWRGPVHRDTQDTPPELLVVDADGSNARTLARGADWTSELRGHWRP
ncbi:MAG: hypothetical protein AB1Z98_28280 [Nannocystaceae bacterium]